MRSMHPLRHWGRRASGAIAIATLSLLTACGGGGSDSGSDTTALAITTDNADTVAIAGVAAMSIGPMASDLSVSLGGGTGVSRVVVQNSHRARALAVAASRQVRPLGTFTQDCSVSGSVSVSLVDLNANGELDGVGESIAIDANACDEGGGSVIDGQFGMAVTAYTDGSNFSFNFSFADLVVVDSSGVTSSMDGDLAMQFSGGDTVVISASSLAVSTDLSGSTQAFSLRDFSTRVVDLGDSVAETVNGVVAGTALGARQVQVSTLSTVVQAYADAYPSAGAVVFTGANNSALKVEAIDATQARLSVDADGDGSYETVKVVLWSELG